MPDNIWFCQTCAETDHQADEGDKENKEREDLAGVISPFLGKEILYLSSSEQSHHLCLELGLEHSQTSVSVNHLKSRLIIITIIIINIVIITIVIVIMIVVVGVTRFGAANSKAPAAQASDSLDVKAWI